MSAPKISLSLAGAQRKGAPVAPSSGQKRSRAVALQDDDEDDQQAYGRAQKVSHFDRNAGGAIDEDDRKDDRPLVIPRQNNRDWREAAAKNRRRQNGRHAEQEQEGNGATTATQQAPPQSDIAPTDLPSYGLNVFAKPEKNGDVATAANPDGDGADEKSEATQQAPTEPENVAPARERTEDEVALDALLGRTVEDRTLILPHQASPLTETDAFRNDYTTAPPMASLDDYARVPVEQFGAALLRGMGWKDGEGIGSQRGQKVAKVSAKAPERRAALLGIGGKDDAAITQELGAWGKAAKGAKGEIKIYNPVLLKDKKTGELFTEEELERKKTEDQRKAFEIEFDQKERERKRRRDDDVRDEPRDKDRRRETDDDYRRDRTRDRRKDSEDEDDYRQKNKDRQRRHERERDDRRDREDRRDRGDRRNGDDRRNRDDRRDRDDRRGRDDRRDRDHREVREHRRDRSRQRDERDKDRHRSDRMHRDGDRRR